MKIHCIRHEPFEGLASIESWVRSNGYKLTYTRTYIHQRFPDDITFDLLIIMGGTTSVYDGGINLWLTAEKKFIQKVINAGKKVLGICLGAQILADLLGAKVYPGTAKEIGWFPVHFNKKEVPGYSFLPEQLTVFHWHGDTFDIPQGAIRLASSKLTPNQGFLLGDKILAMQFHLEMNLNGLKKIIKACARELCTNEECVQHQEMILSQTELIDVNNRLVFKILDLFAVSTSH